MFQNVSMTGVGGIITIIELALNFFNVNLPDGAVATAVNGLVAFLGVAWLVIGQIRARKDLVAGLVRK